jgi:phosphatidate phosphatase PAH1
MRWTVLVALIVAAACATESISSRAIWIAPGGNTACSSAPSRAGGFRHETSDLATSFGEPRHRGVDLVTSVAAPAQVIAGHFGYSSLDKALEDEDVEIFACTNDGWRSIGTTRTDGDGGFALTLSGDHRLGHGLHSLYATASDATGVALSAFVADANDAVAVIDVDGTLTAGENDVVTSVLFGRDPATQRDAPAALRALDHYQWVYVTSRSRTYTVLTRDWLADHGFPPGPVVLASSVMLPGSAAERYKKSALAALRAASVPITIAIGNRATDARAYAAANIPAERIFIKEPEYRDELAPFVAAKSVVPFASYADLPALVAALQ